MPAASWKPDGSKGDALLGYLLFPALALATSKIAGTAGSQSRGRQQHALPVEQMTLSMHSQGIHRSPNDGKK